MKEILGVQLYSMVEVAEMLGVTLMTVSRMLKDGRIEFLQIGHDKYASEDAILRYINGE